MGCCKAALALVAVAANIFPSELYGKRGGRGKVKAGYIIAICKYIYIYMHKNEWALWWGIVFLWGIPARIGVPLNRPSSECWQPTLLTSAIGHWPLGEG